MVPKHIWSKNTLRLTRWIGKIENVKIIEAAMDAPVLKNLYVATQNLNCSIQVKGRSLHRHRLQCT